MDLEPRANTSTPALSGAALAPRTDGRDYQEADTRQTQSCSEQDHEWSNAPINIMIGMFELAIIVCPQDGSDLFDDQAKATEEEDAPPYRPADQKS